MKRIVLIGLLALTGCDEASMAALGGSGSGVARTTSAFTEYLVLGSSMSFEDCRARGGFIIHDQGSPMVACDPGVIRAPVPADELTHPAVQPGQVATPAEEA
jgi:hypothetical protein